MSGRPERSEAAEYFFTYIDKTSGEDVRVAMREQHDQVTRALRNIGEEKSHYRYAEGKWSIREVVSHLSDCERMFVFRAFWFARGFDSSLPSFDEQVAMATANAESRTLAVLVDELVTVREASLTLFDSLTDDVWTRIGTASGNPFSVRALGWIAVGHVEHHMRILRERYL